MNRADRRRLSPVPVDGSEPVTVSREVPVTIIAGANGHQEVVQTDTDEPCYACKCCALWAGTVDTLRVAIIDHERNDHQFGPHEDWVRCLVCQLNAGTADG